MVGVSTFVVCSQLLLVVTRDQQPTKLTMTTTTEKKMFIWLRLIAFASNDKFNVINEWQNYHRS